MFNYFERKVLMKKNIVALVVTLALLVGLGPSVNAETQDGVIITTQIVKADINQDKATVKMAIYNKSNKPITVFTKSAPLVNSAVPKDSPRLEFEQKRGFRDSKGLGQSIVTIPAEQYVEVPFVRLLVFEDNLADTKEISFEYAVAYDIDETVDFNSIAESKEKFESYYNLYDMKWLPIKAQVRDDNSFNTYVVSLDDLKTYTNKQDTSIKTKSEEEHLIKKPKDTKPTEISHKSYMIVYIVGGVVSLIALTLGYLVIRRK